MGKRKRRGRRKSRKGGAPTLFDLPLHADNQPGAEEAEATSPVEETAGGQGPSILFDDPDTEDDRLDRMPLAAGTAGPPEPEAVVEAAPTADRDQPVADLDLAGDRIDPVADRLVGAQPAGEEASDPEDDEAYLGDRLLGGLADLAAQLIAIGLAIAATHSMGIVVSFSDWMPFGVLALVFSFLYWTVPLAFWGQTPGMTWVGHIARSTTGEPLSFGQTFLRWLGSILTLGGVGLPLLLALTGRSLTDRISGSNTTSAD